MVRSFLAAAALLFGAALLSPPARAQDTSLSAREHFARGYALADSGDPAGASTEFELAYAASPNPSVLYNLGQAYAATGRSSEAVDALERYLTLSGTSVPEARAQQVRALISYHAQRVGRVTITVRPPEANVLVDGRAIGTGSRTVSVNAGAHGVVATAPGFDPVSTRVVVVSQQVTTLQLALVAHPEAAALELDCPLEDVSVSIDGQLRGKTPNFRGTPLASGAHRLRFERTGYRTVEQTVELKGGQALRAPCPLAVDPLETSNASLVVRHPEGTVVLVDDSAQRGPLVPAGAHRLRVSGPGYLSETKRIVVQPRARVDISLVPPRDPLALSAEQDQARKATRLGSYVLAGVGLATAVTATALYIDTGARYRAWQTRSRKSVSTLPSDPNAPQALDQLLADENSIRRRDSWALGLTVFSCAALTTSAVLFFSSRSPEQRLIISAGSEPSVRYLGTF